MEANGRHCGSADHHGSHWWGLGSYCIGFNAALGNDPLWEDHDGYPVDRSRNEEYLVRDKDWLRDAQRASITFHVLPDGTVVQEEDR